jgi:uncharacterized protein YmfQ (DUF2313 family)
MVNVILTTETGAPIATETGIDVAAYSFAPTVPPPAAQTPQDYGDEFVALMPRGLAWPRDPDALQVQVADALALTAARVQARANALLVDAFPASSVELLPQWEATLGLPDPCLGPAPTIAQRQQSVVAALTNLGGQSAAYMISVAASLGYSITIETFAPAVYGDSYGRDYAGDAWADTWRVTAPSLVQTFATYGQSYYGEYYSSWGSAVLQCVLNRIKPAQTVLQIVYVGQPATAVLGPVAATPTVTTSPTAAPTTPPVSAFTPPPVLGEFILGRNALV